MSDFKKTDKQIEATALLGSDASDVMLYGGSRSGKTFILVRSLIVRACKETSRHCILRLNFNHIKRTVYHETFPKVMALCFPNLKIKANKSDYFVTFPNGSEIWFAGLDNAERTEKILGSEYSTLYFNESSQIPYSSIQIAKTRLAEKNNLKKKVYYDANPPTKSHWSYWIFEKKLDPIDDVPLSDPESYASLLMNPKDNIQNIDQEYLKLLEKMPEKERNRFLYGLYNDESEGQVYYGFRRSDHVVSIKPIGGTIFIGMDFNVDPMTALICQFIDGELQIMDEIFLSGSADTYKMSHELIRRGYSGGRVIPDSTGRNRKTSGKSDFMILQEFGFAIEKTYNPFVTDRVVNVNRLFGLNKIKIDPKCKKLINDLEKVVWKNNSLDQSGANKHLTHLSDCLGYACWKLLPMVETKEQRTINL